MSTNDTSSPAPAARTSRIMNRVAGALGAGRHPLLTGAVSDLVFLGGTPMSAPVALELLATQQFDVVIGMNGADPLTVYAGADRFDDLTSSLGLPAEAILNPAAADNDLNPDPASEDGASTRRDRIDALKRNRARHNDDLGPMTLIRRLVAQDQVSVAVIVEQADIVLMDPEMHDRADRTAVAELQLASREAAIVGEIRNSVLLLAGRLSSIPPVLLSPGSAFESIDVEPPTRHERVELARLRLGGTWEATQLSPEDRERAVERLADLTDGDPLATVAEVVDFSRRAHLRIDQTQELVNLYRFGPRRDQWSHLLARLPAIRAELRSRVFGQDQAIDKVVEVLSKAALGATDNVRAIGREGRPRGVLTFIGSTGVGKTELAKALAWAIFGDPEAYLRIDMSTFGQSHDAARLIGSPPGYVGYGQGGELTRPVQERPGRVILLDEFTKANAAVFEQLMPVFDDGRVTDAQGRVAYFSEAIIIMTSNAGSDQLMAEVNERGDAVSYEQIAHIAKEAVRAKFYELRLPEFFGRIAPDLVAFDILRLPVVAQIADKVMDGFAFRNGPDVVLDRSSIIEHLRERLALPDARELGGRQVRNEFSRITGEAAATLALGGFADAEAVEVAMQNGRLIVRVDETPIPTAE